MKLNCSCSRSIQLLRERYLKTVIICVLSQTNTNTLFLVNNLFIPSTTALFAFSNKIQLTPDK